MIAGEDLRCGDFVRVDPETGKVVKCTADNFRDHFTMLQDVKRGGVFDPLRAQLNSCGLHPVVLAWGATFYLSDTPKSEALNAQPIRCS